MIRWIPEDLPLLALGLAIMGLAIMVVRRFTRGDTRQGVPPAQAEDQAAASDIAHEFNQCLHVIRLASEATRIDLAGGRVDVDRLKRRSDNILAQVDRLTEMVMRMRATGRIVKPCQPPGPRPMEAGDEDNEHPDGHRRLLLVDDEALSVMMIKEFLVSLGYTVDTAYDGVEALSLAGQHVYDAVVTDIRMPRMDGHALIDRLAQLQPGTPVIVVSGHLSGKAAGDLGDNVQAVLPKPLQLDHLRDCLTRLDTANATDRHLAEGD